MQKMKQKDLGKDKKSRYLEVSPPNMKFTKEDLAKFINCWHYLDPHIACAGAQKSFVTFMNLLNDKKFHEKIDVDFFHKYCVKWLYFKYLCGKILIIILIFIYQINKLSVFS